jgi:hypothetical protein
MEDPVKQCEIVMEWVFRATYEDVVRGQIDECTSTLFADRSQDTARGADKTIRDL